MYMCFHFRNELLDVLSLDEVAMDYVALHYRPAIRRLPPVCWLRIKHDLNTFLEETEADNTITMRWCHSQYREVNNDHVNSHINYSDFTNNNVIQDIDSSLLFWAKSLQLIIFPWIGEYVSFWYITGCNREVFKSKG